MHVFVELSGVMFIMVQVVLLSLRVQVVLLVIVVIIIFYKGIVTINHDASLPFPEGLTN